MLFLDGYPVLSQNSAGSTSLYYKEEGEKIHTGDIAASSIANFSQSFFLFRPHISIYYRRAAIFYLPFLTELFG